MIIREALSFGTASLTELVKDRALFESRLLLSHVLGCNPVELIVDDKRKIGKRAAQEFQDLVERREQDEPVAYLTGQKEFYGRDFVVDSRVLIPRPETESLCEGVVSWLKAEQIESGTILDLGTGSGCIAITLAKELGDDFHIIGVDKSPEALEVAEQNRRRQEAQNCELRPWDILESPNGFSKVQVIVSNPPYIPEEDYQSLSRGIREYEPKEALLAGHEGLDFYRAIFSDWLGLIDRPGLLALETSSEYQRTKIKGLIDASETQSAWINGCHLFKEFMS